MFDLEILNKYTNAKEALKSIETVRKFYKEQWAEADDVKDNSALDEIDERLSELDVMQVEIENILDKCVEVLL